MAYERQDYENALTAFNEVIRLSDNEQTAEARYLKAYIFYLRRDLERAQDICINANKESSGYPFWVAKSVILLSDILREKGDLYNARAALEALLENYNGDQKLVNEAREKAEKVPSTEHNINLKERTAVYKKAFILAAKTNWKRKQKISTWRRMEQNCGNLPKQ